MKIIMNKKNECRFEKKALLRPVDMQWVAFLATSGTGSIHGRFIKSRRVFHPLPPK